MVAVLAYSTPLNHLLYADVPMVYGGADADGQAVFVPRDYDRYRPSSTTTAPTPTT
ncbi:MAG: hypothetical protein ACR2LJ_13235 [Acidimicrobiales bacterium]